MNIKPVLIEVEDSDQRPGKQVRRSLSQPTVSLKKRSTSPKLSIARNNTLTSRWRHRSRNSRTYVTKSVLIKPYDCGPGLSELARQSVFHPTDTSKNRSLGLGPSTTRKSALIPQSPYPFNDELTDVTKRVLIKVHDSDPGLSEQLRQSVFPPTIKSNDCGMSPGALITWKRSLILGWLQRLNNERIYVAKRALIKAHDSGPGLREQGRLSRFETDYVVERRSPGLELSSACKSVMFLGGADFRVVEPGAHL